MVGSESASTFQVWLANGGERSLIWRAVNRSVKIIGPPQRGQVQRGAGILRGSDRDDLGLSMIDVPVESNCLQSGTRAPRRRPARKPK